MSLGMRGAWDVGLGDSHAQGVSAVCWGRGSAPSLGTQTAFERKKQFLLFLKERTNFKNTLVRIIRTSR